MALIMCCTNYVHVVPNYIWPDRSNELGRKVADRTGQIVMWLMPPLVLFAGRNNFMQWISGWPYARFVYIHKWISRIVFFMSIAHAVGMTYNGKNWVNMKPDLKNLMFVGELFLLLPWVLCVSNH